jgi:porphobilinogen synthase
MLANVGADAVAPSDMMDGRIGLIRNTLESAGHHNTQIFAYSVKFHSNFYNPFRDAVGSKNNLSGKDKKTYFTDYRNSSEVISEVALDLSEGADSIIIKPGLMYLDIIQKISNTFHTPVYAYQVSGEYAVLRNAAKQGIIDEEKAVLETLYSFKRAGSCGIITYYADQVIKWIT